MSLQMFLAAIGVVLLIAAAIALVKSEKPLLFQWFASIDLVVWGLFSHIRDGEGLGMLLIFIGAVWLLVQPLPETIGWMKRIERGEKD